MEKGKKTEKVTGLKKNATTRIPKPTTCKIPSAEEPRFENVAKATTAQSSTRTAKMANNPSSKWKHLQITNLPKEVKRMSVAQISRDVMNRFQENNLKPDDHATESNADIKILDKANTIKRNPLIEKCSQASQKQSGRLPKLPSSPDLKACEAFGGMRFSTKRNTRPKFDMFQKMGKESKNLPAVNPSAPCKKEPRRSLSATAIVSKEVKLPNKAGLKGLINVKGESTKAKSHTMKETPHKKLPLFGGIPFVPRWQSTPLKPDLFDSPNLSNHIKGLHPPESSSHCLGKHPNATKAITKNETITLDGTMDLNETITLDETIQPLSEEPKDLRPSPVTKKEIGVKMYPGFAGMRLKPKRKSTHAKPDIFQRVEEEPKIDAPIIPEIQVETPLSDDEKLKLLRTQKAGSSKNNEALKNVKKVVARQKKT